ncbi:unnamed protein product [Arabis nemorensis]|uniref:FLZ-type domain-containing protein n=1 Tax=Arabis nemorensis TaxID=586526 RepID=A0A565B486_9BRAS|nr:unnamed protein product [Arabis nemorensis]
MLLGKRQRPPINRTTSLSEITFDLNLPGESEVSAQQQNPMVSPYGSNGQLRAAAVDQQRGLLDQRGDTAFCSLDCRQEQMAQDERKEKGKAAKESAVAATAKAGKGGRAAAAV